MINYRWPGYAIEGGKIFQTAGVLPGPVGDGPTQAWSRIEKVPAQALLALLAEVEKGQGYSEYSELPDLPSDGVIFD